MNKGIDMLDYIKVAFEMFGPLTVIALGCAVCVAMALVGALMGVL